MKRFQPTSAVLNVELTSHAHLRPAIGGRDKPRRLKVESTIISYGVKEISAFLSTSQLMNLKHLQHEEAASSENQITVS